MSHSESEPTQNRFRFAPSPTGHLHLGHAYSAWLNRRAAEESGGLTLLRIEDIDFTRCKASFGEDLIVDLVYAGYGYDPDIRFQSQHFVAYEEALQKLIRMGVAYSCYCTRSTLRTINGRYAGTCRSLSPTDRVEKTKQGMVYALRLDTQKALSLTDTFLADTFLADKPMDDPVIARKDIGVSYHIAVVVDDALQRISHVIRGADLEGETPYHRLLQALLGLPTPAYFHHSLLMDKDGGKLAKSKGSKSLRDLKEAGVTSAQLHEMLETQARQSGDLDQLLAWLNQTHG